MSSIIRKLLYASIILVMVLTTGTGIATAQDTAPEKPERLSKAAAVGLGEVEDYYGPLSQREGDIKVVVVLSDPGGVEYQASLDENSGLRAANQTMAHINRVQQAQASFLMAAQAAGIETKEIYRVQRVYNGVALAVDSQQVAALAQIEGIKAIYPLITKTLDHVTSVQLINAPQVWGGVDALQGEGVTIAVIDTGIDYLHTNFGGPGTGYDTQDFTTIADGGFPTAKVVGGFDFVGDDYDADATDGRDVPKPDPDPMDCNGHGSHVAGTAAGYGVNKDGTTFTGDYATLKDLSSDEYISRFRIGPGVAPKASLYALRVFGCEGSTDVSDAAVEWAVDPNGDGNFEDHLDIINMSLGAAFGSEYDPSAMAVNNAVLAGVVVVTSAGNSGDVNYITGSPGLARYAISTANSVDASSVLGGFRVNSPDTIDDVYPATEATWGPDLAETGPVTGQLVLATNLVTGNPSNNGCTPFTNAAEVAGKIALVERGACNFTVKAVNAQAAGAIGVLVYNNAPGDPITMGGTDTSITIPGMMTTQAVGNLLKTALAGGPVSVTLTAEFRNTIINVDPSQNDKVVASSSRGLRRSDSGLKPDLTAPGNTIFSTAALTGNEGTSIGGTSMASPHVAGVMALLREKFPDWSVEELKARVMNTATHDLFVGDNQTGNRFTPSRIGAGRVDALNAVAEDMVIAYNRDDPGGVSVSFGVLEVVETIEGADLVTTKTVTIENKGAADASYTVAFELAASYQTNAGVTFALLDAGGAALSNPVTVPAGGSVDVQVQLSIDSSLLQRRRDLTLAVNDLWGLPRQYLTETGGYLTLTPTGGETLQFLRLQVHAAPRPASDLSATVDEMPLPEGTTGSFTVPLTGTLTGTNDPTRTTVLQLLGTSPNEETSVGINNNADLQYVGVMADPALYEDFADASVYFGLSTWGEWSTPSWNEVEFDIYIDSDEDGVPDHLVLNMNSSGFTATVEDSFVSAFCPYPVSNIAQECDFWYFVNAFSGSTNTNPFNSSVMLLPVPATGIGLSETNTSFNFFVSSFSRESAEVVDTTDWMTYDVGNMVIDTNDTNVSGFPMWRLDAGVEIEVTYDKSNISADTLPLGLLLLHHHNTTGKMAEVIEFTFNMTTMTPASDYELVRPAFSVPVEITLENTSAQNCTFDLSYKTALGFEVVGPAARFVPTMGMDTFTVIVHVPADAEQGAFDRVQVTAVCREQDLLGVSAFTVQVAHQVLMPFISR